MNPLKKMIDSVVCNNVSSFQGDFDTEVKTRIGLRVNDKRGGTSSTLLSPDSTEDDILGMEFGVEEHAELTRRLSHSLRFVTENKEAVVLELMNGDEVDLDVHTANNLTSIHDSLTENNQIDFRNQVMRDGDSFEMMRNFAANNTGRE
tara:strand:- start:252 stop:695 length:444 start_codon:yes stop_codon:yes gene_type:complete